MTTPAPPADFDAAPDYNTAPATPAYVLAVLRDWRRYADFPDPETELNFDTPVEDWELEFDYDLVFRPWWKVLGESLNELFDLAVPLADWKPVLRPAGDRTVGDVCRFVAGRATRPVVRPANIAGTTCAKAGAFRAVRGLLIDAGLPPAEAARVAPSRPLEPYATRFAAAFVTGTARLAPGVLPGIVTGGSGRPAWFLVGLFGLPVVISTSPLLGGAGFLLCTGGFCIAWAAVWRVLPEAPVRFGDLRTFRDLAEALAAAEPA